VLFRPCLVLGNPHSAIKASVAYNPFDVPAQQQQPHPGSFNNIDPFASLSTPPTSPQSQQKQTQPHAESFDSIDPFASLSTPPTSPQSRSQSQSQPQSNVAFDPFG
jgi:hypothetical protein